MNGPAPSPETVHHVERCRCPICNSADRQQVDMLEGWRKYRCLTCNFQYVVTLVLAERYTEATRKAADMPRSHRGVFPWNRSGAVTKMS